LRYFNSKVVGFWKIDFWFRKNPVFTIIFIIGELWPRFLSSKFRFLAKISIFGENLNLWSKFRFLGKLWSLAKISIFGENFNIWSKFQFLGKISIFGQNFYFSPKFRLLGKISIFGQNFYFSPKFLFLGKISIFTLYISDHLGFSCLFDKIIYWAW